MRFKTSHLILLIGLVLVMTVTATAQQQSEFTIYLYRGGQASPVTRHDLLSGDLQSDATTLITALLAGPTAGERLSGLISPLPAGARLSALILVGDEATIDLRLPSSFLQDELDVYLSDAIVDQIVKTLHPLGIHHIIVRAEDQTGGFVPVSAFLPRPSPATPTIPTNDDAIPVQQGSVPAEHRGLLPASTQGQPQGPLSGKTVWLSAGHGWYWSDLLNRWNTQRGNNYGLVEDMSNAEAVNYYLAHYLWNAGADVWFVREHAMNEHEIIVDNDAGSPSYFETGSWTTSSSPGYNDSTYRYSITSSALSATATWTPDLPATGRYAVWAWYRHGTNRAADARYEIHHAGGVATVSTSQETHGQTWRYLGEYWFEAGSTGHVTLINESDDLGQAIIADAVRFGGGLGSIVAPGGTSGEPRWEEAAKYWAQYEGAPSEIYENDVTARPLYAEWESAKGYPDEAENAVYVSWHTNAGGGTGTESYIHSTEPTTGSAELQDWVHAELIGDLKAAWDPDWVNRGQKSADFGELRELSAIPGVLLEIAFHDTEDPGDASDLREPIFRQIAARAVYQGIAQYYANREGMPAHLLPEPPERLVARNTAPGQITLTWTPPPCCDDVVGDAATAYQVYHSVEGRAFDSGTQTANPSLVLTNLAPGTLHFFRVTALNEGGESLPTPVVAARTPVDGGSPPLLIVDGFDRLDQIAMIPQWESPALGIAQRMFLERMNRYDYAVEHGTALSTCDLAFDGAVNEAVEAGAVTLSDYRALDWFVGEDSAANTAAANIAAAATTDPAAAAADLADVMLAADATALSDTERGLLAAYLDGGGRLLISGSEIGYDLVEKGRDPTFYRYYLRAEYLGDDAETYEVAGSPESILGGLSGIFDDSTGGYYDVGYPDRVASIIGSTSALNYIGGTSDGAAIAYSDRFRVAYFGFPLETVTDPATRADLLCTAADYLLAGDGRPASTQRIINPGFEQGLSQSAWQASSSGDTPLFYHRDDLDGWVEPASGDWLAWLGAYNPGLTLTAALTQVVALPAGEPTATLSVAWLLDSAATPAVTNSLLLGVYDLSGTLQNALLTVTNESPAGTWHVDQFDLSAFAGETLQIAFRAASRDAAFFVDDVNLATTGPAGPDEFRALWVDAYHEGIKDRIQVDELVETARAGGFNALVVQVRRRGDTYYPSTLDPWAPDADPEFDALAYLIESAHAAGIEVHAWATTLAIWNGDTPPDAAEHTFYEHGPGTLGRDYWLMTSFAGEEAAGPPRVTAYYLDPGHPDAVDYTVAVYAELAANYDLDGLHLDHIRYPEYKGAYCQDQVWYCQDWGYNPTSVSRFQAQTGRGDVPDPLDEEWVQWRRDQVTALVRRIYLTSAAINPRLRVSAALSTSGAAPTDEASWYARTPYIHQLQDWRGWLAEGILDLGMPMTYRDDDTYADQFDGWIDWQKDHQYSRSIVVGTGLYLNAIQDSMAQWLRVRLPSGQGNHALGMNGYSYATSNDEESPRRDFVNAVVTQVFTRSAASPAIPWKDTPTLGHVMGTLTQTPTCLNLDGYPLTLNGPQQRSLYTGGSGWFGAVDLPPGDYVLSADIPTPSTTISLPVSVYAGVVSVQQLTLPPCPRETIYLPLVQRQASR